MTAGPCREPIDPVRFISNRSSGRMGYAVARAAAEAGADVMLISGPTALELPDRVRCEQVSTARQMHTAVMRELAGTDIFIGTAAVADYACNVSVNQKIKKSDAGMTLILEPTPDILADVAKSERVPFTVGFAAETERVLEYARQKLISKQLDLIAANQVGENQGFESEENHLQVIWHEGSVDLGLASKEKLARELVAIIARRFHEKHTHQTH